MISYEEAYRIAKKWLRKITRCIEYENAWLFEDGDWIEAIRGLEMAGGYSGQGYVMKRGGRLIVGGMELMNIDEQVGAKLRTIEL